MASPRWPASVPQLAGGSFPRLADERAASESGATPQALELEADGWRFALEAWPRQADHRGKQAYAGVVGPTTSAIYDHAGSLLKRLEHKATRYGRQTEPLLLVVHADRPAVREQDVDGALHGRSIGTVRLGSTEVHPTSRRTHGLWHHEGRAICPQVAGVLVMPQELKPWTVADAQPTLWLHPDPDVVLPPLPFARIARAADKVVRTPSTFRPEALTGVDGGALGADWPGSPVIARSGRR